ncbi:hypothetical protein [Methylopila turkensis]|uniref:Uncharacterized protein n=1 Tax=Methylopila turkensis TaxID=1437816 RepID=A0A9W6JMM6_9HYPH|nr:hypothetical protein [Methylopila turkensis]GLK80415.1 hypothetical protein GCM10008174_21560 [Methylopila turkensis]
MSTLQQFVTAAAVVAGSGSYDLRPALAALDAFVGGFEDGARRNALTSARRGLASIQLDGSTNDALVREIEVRISRSTRSLKARHGLNRLTGLEAT